MKKRILTFVRIRFLLFYCFFHGLLITLLIASYADLRIVFMFDLSRINGL